MDFIENAEHLLLRDAISSIATDFGHDYFVACSTEHRFPDELWDAIFTAGYGGVNLPEDYGGGGGGMSEMAIVIEELAAAGCPLLFLIVAGMCGPVIAQFGTDAQRRRWLPAICGGQTKMAFAVTEADAGSNFYQLSTAATRSGDGWVLRGAKQFITGIDVSEAVLVVCRTGTDDRGRGALSLFIVDTDAAGVHSEPIATGIQAPDRQFLVRFDDVAVPADRLIGEVADQGARQIFASLNSERISVASQANGLARYFTTKATRYANERAVWGAPIGAHQGVAHPLAEAKIETELARLMTAKAAWLFDRGMDSGETSGIAKLAAADAAMLCFDQAVQIHGGNGFASEYGIADLWGLTRLMRSAPVSREMVLNYVAQHSLGLPRSY